MYYCLFEVFKDWLKMTWLWSVLLTWALGVTGPWLTEQAEQWGQCLCSLPSLQCVCLPSWESRNCPFIPTMTITRLLADRSTPAILGITQSQFLGDKKNNDQPVPKRLGPSSVGMMWKMRGKRQLEVDCLTTGNIFICLLVNRSHPLLSLSPSASSLF